MPTGPPPSRWRPTPRRAAMLLAGLWAFGTGEGLLVTADVGSSPWTVFAQGVARVSGTTVGVATIVVGVAVLALWLPLRQRPGLGTIANALVVGVALDATVAVVGTPSGVVARLAVALLGVVVVGAGSGLYLGSALGPGPRDGLMTGLHRVTGRSLSLTRWTIEVVVLAAGYLLGGTVGIATLLFAVLIGPVVQVFVRLFSIVSTDRL